MGHMDQLSSDGLNYVGVGIALFDVGGNGVVYGNGLFIACGQISPGQLSQPPSSNGNIARRSSDGINWDPIRIPSLSTAQAAAYSGTEGIYALAGQRSAFGSSNPEVFAFSRDGMTWSPAPSNTPLFGNNLNMAAVLLQGNGIWFA